MIVKLMIGDSVKVFPFLNLLENCIVDSSVYLGSLVAGVLASI